MRDSSIGWDGRIDQTSLEVWTCLRICGMPEMLVAPKGTLIRRRLGYNFRPLGPEYVVSDMHTVWLHYDYNVDARW